MKYRLRRLTALSLGLSLTLSLHVLSGCGTPASNTAASTSSENAAEVPAATEAEASSEEVSANTSSDSIDATADTDTAAVSAENEDAVNGSTEAADDSSAASADLYNGQVLLDLSFEDGTIDQFFAFMEGGECELLNQDGALACRITKTGQKDYANQAYLDGFSLTEGVVYTLSFDASSDADCSMQYRIQLNGGDYHAYVSDQAVLNADMTHFEKEFTMKETTDPAPRLAFNMGMQPDMTEDPGEHTIRIDNIHLEVLDTSGAVSESLAETLPLLSVNHVGYRTDDRKAVVTDGVLAGSEFEVIDADGKTCFTGTFGDARDDAAVEKEVCSGDFSNLDANGIYTVHADYNGTALVSQPFTIADDVYTELTDSVFRMLLFQRCGEELTDGQAWDYAHPACHTGQALIYGSKETKDVTGGWHDAGDYGRYVVSGAQTVADLLYICESGSGNEQLLDEARYELEWMLKMQDEKTGGVYHKVTCENFPGTVMPQDEKEQLVLAPISAAATGDFAAVMAKAAEDYSSSDPAFAKKCGDAAISAWSYLTKQDKLTGFTNPAGIVTGEYPDEELDDELLWAAVELMDQIGKGNIDSSVTDSLKKVILKEMEGTPSCGLGWADMGGFALYDLAKITSNDADIAAASEKAASLLLKEADVLHKLIQEDGYSVSMGVNYYWGSNMGVANNGMLLLMASELGGKEEYKTDAKLQLDYLLGVNGLDFCYVSGFGDKCLSDPHHRPSQYVGKAVPGMLAGGPNPNLEDPYAQQVLAGRAPALCYDDNQQSYSTNEVAIYWNSPLLVLLCGI